MARLEPQAFSFIPFLQFKVFFMRCRNVLHCSYSERNQSYCEAGSKCCFLLPVSWLKEGSYFVLPFTRNRAKKKKKSWTVRIFWPKECCPPLLFSQIYFKKQHAVSKRRQTDLLTSLFGSIKSRTTKTITQTTQMLYLSVFKFIPLKSLGFFLLSFSVNYNKNATIT